MGGYQGARGEMSKAKKKVTGAPPWNPGEGDVLYSTTVQTTPDQFFVQSTISSEAAHMPLSDVRAECGQDKALACFRWVCFFLAPCPVPANKTEWWEAWNVNQKRHPEAGTTYLRQCSTHRGMHIASLVLNTPPKFKLRKVCIGGSREKPERYGLTILRQICTKRQVFGRPEMAARLAAGEAR